MLDYSTLMTTMSVLGDKFKEECSKVDPLHPDRECDTDYIQNYAKAYNIYKIYMNMPEYHQFKSHYLVLLSEAMKKLV